MQTFRKDNNNMNRSFQKPPVNVGDEFDATVEGVGEKGDGFIRKDGFVLFVQNVKKGDQVRIKVNKVLKKVGFAEVLGQATGAPSTLTESSPAETTAPAVPATPKPEDTEEF
jgi:predicted RNA-binding protein with TRAM domain